MRYSYSISSADRRATVVVEGAFDLANSLRAIGEVADSPRFDPEYSILVDLRQMEYQVPEFDDLLATIAVTEIKRESFRGPVAFVSIPGPFFDVVRLGCSQGMFLGINVEAFTEISAAEAWLKSGGGS